MERKPHQRNFVYEKLRSLIFFHLKVFARALITSSSSCVSRQRVLYDVEGNTICLFIGAYFMRFCYEFFAINEANERNENGESNKARMSFSQFPKNIVKLSPFIFHFGLSLFYAHKRFHGNFMRERKVSSKPPTLTYEDFECFFAFQQRMGHFSFAFAFLFIF